MRSRLGYRAQAAVLLALVALVGALAGVVADRALNDRWDGRGEPGGVRRAPPPGAGLWRWEARPDARYADRLAARLNLSADQRARIDSILAEEQARVRELTREVAPQFRTIAEQTRSRIEGVLTDSQRERLRELRDERMRGRRFRAGPERSPRRP